MPENAIRDEGWDRFYIAESSAKCFFGICTLRMRRLRVMHLGSWARMNGRAEFAKKTSVRPISVLLEGCIDQNKSVFEETPFSGEPHCSFLEWDVESRLKLDVLLWGSRWKRVNSRCWFGGSSRPLWEKEWRKSCWRFNSVPIFSSAALHSNALELSFQISYWRISEGSKFLGTVADDKLSWLPSTKNERWKGWCRFSFYGIVPQITKLKYCVSIWWSPPESPRIFFWKELKIMETT